MKTEPLPTLMPSKQEMDRAFAAKDPGYDGVFFVAVKTTGIFCRPSCPSSPNPKNVEFFSSVKDCLAAGYRPCRRCRPLETNGRPPEWVRELMSRVESSPGARLTAADWRELGITDERARRWFQQHYGMSFVAWCRGNRLAGAFARLRRGEALDEVTLDSGFESHSGFREAFTRTFGAAPGQSRHHGSRLLMTVLESPLGPLLAGAGDEGLSFLEFTEGGLVEQAIKALGKRFDCAVVPGRHRLFDQLKVELEAYFAGRLRKFSLPLTPRGSVFQEKVWQELRRIPCGQTISYHALAGRIGQPTARRAVAGANNRNPICILIPCHRVIGKDGSLTGYGGGLWRKRLLLELERTGQLPGNDGKAEEQGAVNVADDIPASGCE
jgi:AraC family transcriptional regulator of adaptative response/methylated-DNA-[protein]-cysteine methyltransferase